MARQIEHTLWWRGKPFYQSANDLKKAKAAGILIGAPSTLAGDGIVLTPVGRKDPSNSELYALATRQVWQVMGEVVRRARARSENPKTYRIESLVRTVKYSHLMGRGASDTSHNFGGAFDISLKQDTTSLAILHHTLYEMAQDGTLSYYIESNKSYGGTLAVFPTPYDFHKAGQVHVIVNPYLIDNEM